MPTTPTKTPTTTPTALPTTRPTIRPTQNNNYTLTEMAINTGFIAPRSSLSGLSWTTLCSYCWSYYSHYTVPLSPSVTFLGQVYDYVYVSAQGWLSFVYAS